MVFELKGTGLSNHKIGPLWASHRRKSDVPAPAWFHDSRPLSQSEELQRPYGGRCPYRADVAKRLMHNRHRLKGTDSVGQIALIGGKQNRRRYPATAGNLPNVDWLRRQIRSMSGVPLRLFNYRVPVLSAARRLFTVEVECRDHRNSGRVNQSSSAR
jgi:hypothetical protein